MQSAGPGLPACVLGGIGINAQKAPARDLRQAGVLMCA
jgi:hypothetical protein